MEKQYKYSTKFTAKAHIVAGPAAKMEARASLANLGAVFNDDTVDDILENPDLLYISSPLIQLGVANLNDDAVTAESIIPVAHKFKKKFIDIEHDRGQGAVGAITDISYCWLTDDNEKINEGTALADQSGNAALVIGGYLWRLINKDLCEFVIKDSAEGKKEISTSFELLFDSYVIGIGFGGNRLVSQATIIKPNDPEWDHYNAILRIQGGAGMTESGDLVFTILQGDILPVGAGLVAEPASGIKGVLAITSTDQLENEEDKKDEAPEAGEPDKVDVPEEAGTIVSTELIINPTIASVSAHITSTDITVQPTIPMKIEKLEDISAQWAELSKHEASASVITEFIKAKLEEFSLKWNAEKQAKENLAETVQANAAEIEVLKTSLAEIEAARASEAAESAFNSRMAALDEEFTLDDEDRAILVDDVKACESDEAFAKLMKKCKKLMKTKMKSAAVEAPVAPVVAAVVAPVIPAEPVVNVHEIVASVKEVAHQEIPNGPVVTESLKDKLYNSFANHVTVGGQKIKKNKKA